MKFPYSSIKPCEKNNCKNGGTCIKTNSGEICVCKYPCGGQRCVDSHWCSEGFGSTECPRSQCRFNFTTDVGYCLCPSNHYFNYILKKCVVIDPCLLMLTKCNSINEICRNGVCVCKKNFKRNNKNGCIPNFCESNPCEENEVCEDIVEETDKVKCSCKENYIFDGSTCRKGDICNLSGKLGCQQICNAEKGSCECKPGFRLQSDQKSCKLFKKVDKCTKRCGVGVCMKSKVGDICVCPRTHILRKSTCIDLCTARLLPLGLCPNNACVTDKVLGFKCICVGKLAYDENGVSCRKKRMCEEGEGNQACRELNAFCSENFNASKGYECKCKNGQAFDIDKKCKHKCQINAYKERCEKVFAFCEVMENEVLCKCPPMLTFNSDGRCTEIAQHSFIGTLPIAKQYYMSVLVSGSSYNHTETNQNYDILKNDIQKSMQTLHGINYKQANIINCEINVEDLECLVEIQFKSDPVGQAQITSDPSTCINVSNEICLIPPHLLLKKKEIKTKVFRRTDPCMKEIKYALCGSDSECFNVEDGSSNFECRCKKGFISKAIFRPLSDNRTVVQKCEDIDECLDPQSCPNKTRCLNTFGSYECLCLKGYRPLTSRFDIKITGCVEICDPKACKHGKCEDNNGLTVCKCEEGFAGLNCEYEVLDEANQHGMKISIIVLSSISVSLIFLSVCLIWKFCSSKSKSYQSSYQNEYSSTIGLQHMR